MASVSRSTSSGPNRWRARWRGPDGRQHERAFRTKEQATQHLAEVELGGHVDPQAGQRLVSAALAAWLEDAVPRLSPKTASSYRSLGRLLSAALGRRQLRALSTAEVQRAVAGWQRKGLSPSRIRQAVRLLGQVLDAAVADRAVQRNATQGVKLPAMPTKRTPGFTPEQADEIAAGLPERYELLALVLGHAGLRWAEAAGLRVEQLDFDRRRILVDRSTSQADGHLHDRSTKTGRERTVPMTSDLAERLQRACRGLSGDARVFTMPEGGALRYDNWMRDVWRPAGIEGGPHGLRKAAATRFLRAGVPVHVVQRIMGHSDPQVTLNIYAEVADADLDAAASQIECGALVGPARLRVVA